MAIGECNFFCKRGCKHGSNLFFDRIIIKTHRGLHIAMQKEGTSSDQYDSLLWIMAQESSGVVNAKNPHSSARGLYQLTKANYNLNPNGENSFDNAVEECQGGIRYITSRYGNSEKAVEFWKQNGWY